MSVRDFFQAFGRINRPAITRTELTVRVEREPLDDGSERVTRTRIRRVETTPTVSLSVFGRPFPRRK